MKDYIPPSKGGTGFNCPHCGAYAHQWWSGGMMDDHRVESSTCARCDKYAVWHDDKMIFPLASSAPLPSEDMPSDVKEDFLEARNIVNLSPRAAAALLRLCVQKLMPYVDERGKNLNDDIGNLVKKGKLPERVYKALDSVRVIGNNSVHPGQIDLKDDIETATILFELLNMIVEAIITQKRKVDTIFDKLPSQSKKQIKKRNDTK